MQDNLVVKQFNKNKPCYYCGAPPPSSREHAPVKSMFEAFDCDSITVPACDKHNTEKHLDDRAIVAFFLGGLYTGFKSGVLTENVLRAFEEAERNLKNAREVTLRPWVSDPLGNLDTPLSHIDALGKVRAWMRQLTAALVWSVVGEYDPEIKWDEAIVWSPEFAPDTGLLSIEEAGIQLERLQSIKANVNGLAVQWWPGWSSYPREYPRDIYRFELSFLPSQYLLIDGSKLEILFRHWFYGQFSWYVWFTTSQQIKLTLVDTVKKIHS
jgi:hypothetical protein